MNKSKQGGARPGAGRKPSKEKKVAFFIYILPRYIRKAGGKQKAKELAERAIMGC